MGADSKNPFWQNLQTSTLLRFLLLFACGWAIVILITYFYKVIAIFTAAGIFAALLNYPVRWLSRYIPRGVAIPTVFLATLAILIAIVTALGIEVITQGQGLAQQIADQLKNQDLLPLKGLLKEIDFEKIYQTLQSGLASGLGIVQQIFSSVFTFIFLAVISLYMLIDGGKLWTTSLKLIPEKSRDRFATTFQKSFLGFLRGQIILMLFLSFASLVIFSLLGVRYALFLALIVGILDAIPGIGATLGVLLITLLVLASQGVDMAVRVVVASLILQQIQDNLVHPKVMGDSLELSPVLLFLALFIGERVAGILGVFISIPIAGMIAAWMRAEAAEVELEAAEAAEAIGSET